MTKYIPLTRENHRDLERTIAALEKQVAYWRGLVPPEVLTAERERRRLACHRAMVETFRSGWQPMERA